MSDFEWYPYVPVAERRRQAKRQLAKLKQRDRSLSPVTIDGRKIARSFWGESWCGNLERYSDYQNRLPRGRTYVRNGSVLDLQITEGKVAAMVAGSDLYRVEIAIKPVTAARWRAICRDCAGTVDSLVELLQGRLAKGVMDRVCRKGDGLFPSPGEIKLSCSCPDWADMCKHVAAALYGVGARLDQAPRLLFVLRGVDESELLVGKHELPLARTGSSATQFLDDVDAAELFGLEMAENAGVDPSTPAVASHRPPRSKPGKTRMSVAQKRQPPRTNRTGSQPLRRGSKSAR